MFRYILNAEGKVRAAEVDEYGAIWSASGEIPLPHAMEHPAEYWPVQLAPNLTRGWHPVEPCEECGYHGYCGVCGFNTVRVEKNWLRTQVALALNSDPLMHAFLEGLDERQKVDALIRLSNVVAEHVHNNASMSWLLEQWRRENVSDIDRREETE